ncbi:MAG: choice-of-anchor J domain-containing protein, partial [Bacteroidales bacterium]|nr:choice-of-anchor J domain-containing protein [Bacteroidales bacterium]
TDHYGSNEVLLNGLAGSSSFLLKAASLCDDGTVSSKVSTTFTTPCGAITHDDMPFTEGFEDYELEVYQDHEIGLCWHRFNYYNTTSVIPYVHNQNPHSGSKSIKFTTNQNYRPAFLVMPRVDYLDDVKLSFWVRRSNANYSGIQVGVMSDPTDSTTFVNVATFGSGTYDWTQYEVTFENYTGTGKYIAFRNRVNAPSTTYADIYLDDILLEVVDPCPRAESVAATAIEATSATLTVTDTLTGVSYQALVSDGTWDTTILFSGNNIVIGGLTPHTDYSVELRSVCDNGLLTGPVYTSFQTEWYCPAIDIIPWSEDFDNMEAGLTAPCWIAYYHIQNSTDSNFVRDTLPYIRASQTYINDDNHAAGQTLYMMCQSSGGTHIYSVAYLPEIGDTLSDLKIRFWYKATSNYNNVELLVGISDLGPFSNGEYDTTTFVRHALIVPEDNYFHEYEVELGNIGNSSSRITFIQRPHPGSSMFGYGYLDEVRVVPSTACHRPLRVAALPLSTDSAFVHWTETDTVGTYKVVWHSDLANDSTVVVGDTTCLLTGLSPATYYNVEVSKLCDSVYTIARSTSFLTRCAIITHNDLPWTEDFESYNMIYNQWRSNPCWTMHDYDNAAGWYPRISNTQAIGQKSLMFSPGNNKPQYAVLPALDDLSDVTLRFHYYGGIRSTLAIGVMDDPTDTTTFVQLISIPYMNDIWESDEVNLASYTGTGHYIALRAGRTNAPGNSFVNTFVDSIQICISEACPSPSGIAATATSSTTATLSVIDPANIGHYMLYLHRGTTTGNVVDLAMPDSLEIWTPSHTLSALLPQTEYCVEVATICPDGTHTTRRSCIFRTDCIILTRDDLPYIQDFEMGFSTPPAAASAAFGDPCWTLHDYSGNGYPVLTSSQASSGGSSLVFFSPNDSLPQYAVTPQFDSLQGLKVRLKLLGSSYYASDGLVVGSMGDPADTATFTPLATLLADGDGWSNFAVSLDSYSGDDHYLALRHGGGRMCVDSVVVEQDARCNGVGELTVVDVTATSATVYEVGNTGMLHRRVDLYSDEGHVAFDTVVQGGLVMGGLRPNTVYRLLLRNVCEDGRTTSPGGVQFVTLPLDCQAPRGLQLLDATTSQAVLGWTAGGGESGWLLEVWGQDFDSLYTLTSNPASIGGLEPSTSYHATICSLCGAAWQHSEYGDTIVFSTVACATPGGPTVVVLSPTAARVEWAAEAESYTIEYGPAGFADGEGTQVLATTSPHGLDGLTPGSHYEVHLRANCPGGTTSGWSGRTSFATTLGMETFGGMALAIAPNPARGTTMLTVEGSGGEATVDIVDLKGRTVRSLTVPCAGGCSAEVDLGELAAGVYFVHLRSANGRAVRRLVVTRE